MGIALVLSIGNLVQNSIISSGLEQEQQTSLGISRIIANQFRDTYYTTRRLTLEQRDANLQTELLEIEGRIFILDHEDRVVLDTANQYTDRELSLTIIDRVRTDNNSLSEVYRSSGGDHILYTVVPFKLRDVTTPSATVLYIKDVESIYQNAQDLISKSMRAGVIILIISGFLMMLSNYKLLEPVRELQLGVEAMTRGSYAYQIKKLDQDDELAKIARSFNVMAGRLHEIYDRQSEFVSNVSHELKTPIASLKIISQSLLSAHDVPMEVVNEFLEDINTEANRMQEIVDDLLYVAKLERSDMSLDLEISNIGKAVEESVKVVLPIALKKDIDVTIRGEHKYFIEMDYNKIKQVIINLLNNAIKYSPPDTLVEVSVTEHRNEVQIDIKDQGYGIPEGDIPYLFDRFFRVDKARSRPEGGSGLGLNISNQIVALHHGRFEVQSTLSVGSTFSVFIPKRYQV